MIANAIMYVSVLFSLWSMYRYCRYMKKILNKTIDDNVNTRSC